MKLPGKAKNKSQKTKKGVKNETVDNFFINRDNSVEFQFMRLVYA
jgi:preprotein translocase subunit Sec63